MKKILFIAFLFCCALGVSAQEVIVTNARSYFYEESTGDTQKMNQFKRPMSFQMGMVFVIKGEENGRYLTDWGWIKGEDTTTATANDIHSGAFPISNMGGTLLEVTCAGDKITTRGPGLYLTGQKVEKTAPAILFYNEYKDLVLTAVKIDGKFLLYSYDSNWTGW